MAVVAVAAFVIRDAGGVAAYAVLAGVVPWAGAGDSTRCTLTTTVALLGGGEDGPNARRTRALRTVGGVVFRTPIRVTAIDFARIGSTAIF